MDLCIKRVASKVEKGHDYAERSRTCLCVPRPSVVLGPVAGAPDGGPVVCVICRVFE